MATDFHPIGLIETYEEQKKKRKPAVKWLDTIPKTRAPIEPLDLLTPVKPAPADLQRSFREIEAQAPKPLPQERPVTGAKTPSVTTPRTQDLSKYKGYGFIELADSLRKTAEETVERQRTVQPPATPADARISPSPDTQKTAAEKAGEAPLATSFVSPGMPQRITAIPETVSREAPQPPAWLQRVLSGRDIFGLQEREQRLREEGWEPEIPEALKGWEQTLRKFEKTKTGQYILRLGEVAGQIVAPGKSVYEEMPSTGNQALDFTADIIGTIMGFMVPGGVGRMGYEAVSPATNMLMGRFLTGKAGERLLKTMASQKVLQELGPVPSPLKDIVGRVAARAVIGGLTSGINFSGRRLLLDALQLQGIPNAEKAQEVAKNLAKDFGWGFLTGAILGGGRAIIKEASPYFNKESMVRQGYREIKDPATKKGLDIYWKETRVRKGEQPVIEFVVVRPTEETLQARIDYLYKYSQTEWAQTPRGREMVARIKGTVDAYELGKTGAYAIIPELEPPYPIGYPWRTRPETQERVQRILDTLSGKAPSRGPAPTTVPGLLKGRVELPSTERAQQAPSKLPTFTVSAEDVSKMRPMTSPARIVKNIINPAQLRQLVRDGAARSASEINNATVLAYQKATERGLEHKQARKTVQGIVDAFRKSDLKITEENVAKYFDNIDAGFGPEEAVKMIVEGRTVPAEAGEIVIGSTVYHPKTGEALTVVDVSDPSLLTVKNQKGAEFKIGRKAVLTKPPVVSPEERRTNLALRAEIDKLSPEEKDEVIRDLRRRVFTDELTGLKNRAAYMVDEKQPFQAIIDLDNLKWINDNIGHAAGDTLIKTFANALPEGAYRISGDEFVVQGKSREELDSALSSIEALLNEQIIELVGDKKTVFKKGIGFSYGIGETLDKAETALQEHKKTRLAEGKRVERGEAPEGIVEKEEETPAKEPWEMTVEEYVNAAQKSTGKDPETPHISQGTFREHWEKQHRDKVKDAIQKGKPVPPEVLKDYPELKVGEKPAARTIAAPETRKAVIENVSVSSVEMKDGTKRIKLSAPYHPGLPDKAKAIGGRWSSERKAWYFDERDEERVRKLAQEIYGTRGEGEQVDIVTVRVNLDDVEGAKYGSLFLFGREVASRRSRDQRVRLGDGVIIVKGGFPASGGSMRYPSLAPEEGTILEIRDVPLSLVQAAKFTVEIVPETREEAPAEEKEEAPPTKVEKPAVEKPAVPEKKVKDNVEWLKEAAAEARKRIEARKARRGEEGLPEELAFGMPAPGKQAKLPMEDLVDYAIVGAEYIVTKNPSYEDWAELMLEEFGPAIKLFLRGIYGQSQAMLEMTPEEIGEMIKIVEKEVPEGDVPDEHGPRALEETSSEDVQGTKGERPTDESGERGGGEDSGGIRGAAGTGTEVRPGVGDRPGEIHTAPGGKGATGVVTQTTEPRSITSQNFRIAPEIAVEINTRSKKEKTRDNITAIRLLKQLMTEERPATPEEQAILVKYVGWGFNKDIFNEAWAKNNGYEAEHNELKELLTEEEWKYARRSTLYAHYTATDVVEAMYEVLKRIGFDGGKVLEPAMGIGHFFGLMPDEMREASWLTGVEIDKTSGNIARLLYPRANINIMGYEEFAVPYEEKKLLNENYYDLVISNVPFSDTPPAKDARYRKIPNRNLHNFFFAKAIDQVRPGGALMFITSHYTMDSIDASFRKYMNERADFLGAVRLHNEAFKGIAETNVVTDIIFMRKRAEGEKYAGEDWIKTKQKEVEVDGRFYRFNINEYYVDNPEMVIGKQIKGRGMYGSDEYIVVPDTDRQDLRKEIVDAFSKILPEDAYKPRPKHEATEDPKVGDMLIPPPETQPGSFFIKDGKIYQAYVDESGQLFMGPYNEILEKDGLPAPGAKVISRIKGLIKLRDVFTELVNLELKNAPEAVIDKQRKELNKVYDSFVEVHGLVNKRANAAAFKDDPSYYRLTGLEVIDPDTGNFVKNDIFYRRTITKYIPATKADNEKEALLITLNERGRVDVEHIAALTGKDVEAVTKELKGAIFNDPEKGWVTADEYLSGNVREKLRIARDAARHDPSFEDNVTALEAVQPVDKTPEDIYVKLGASWISPEDVRDFLGHLFFNDESYGAYFDIRYVPANASWIIEFTSARAKANVRGTTYNQTVYALNYRNEATGRYIKRDALYIIDRMLNSKSMIATYKDPDTERYKVHAAASLAMKEKAKQIEDEFRKWLWSDESRKKRLLKKYNWEYNSIRKREWNGEHLTFPGMNPVIELAKHQKDAVWQIIQGVPTLLHHTVGAGKTFEMVAAAMELKRLGFASKPLIVTRNHLVGDIHNEARKLYPAAKIIHYTEKDFYKNNRRKTLAKIVAGDWDLIIMPHSSFKFIPVSAKYAEKLVSREIDKIERSILDARIAEGQVGKAIIRDMENAKIRAEKKLRDRLKDIREHQDQGFITFEETGIDAIFIDEAHHFKNLLYSTRMNRVGNLGSQDGSQAAFDLLTKVEYIRELRGGSGIVFATATPLSNTMAEIYHMQRYLQPDELEAKGIYSFDAWAQTFGEIVTGIELKPSGKGYQPKERFRKFNNLSALMQMYHSFANVVNRAKMLELNPNMKLPKLATGKRQMILSEPSTEMQLYIEELDHRLDQIKSGAVTPREDNTLKILADGKMAALFGPLRGLPDYKGSKISNLVENVYKIWERDKKDKLTQLVFLDLGTPKGDSGEVDEDTGEAKMTKEEKAYWAEVEALEKGVYEVIKRRLIVLGVPEEEMAIVHDYNTDAKKQRLFRQVRSGEVRILIGSTRKMGEGMNVQRRLKALHHVDAPWKPSEIEQREGRIIRQGNLNEEVEIYCYATTGTLDTFFWQTLEQKQGYLFRFESGDMTLDQMDDIDESTASYAMLKALATGDQRIVEHAELTNRMIELKALEQGYNSTQTSVQLSVAQTEAFIESREKILSKAEADLKKRQDISRDKFKITLFGKEYTKRMEAGDVLIGKEGPLKEILKQLPEFVLWKSHYLVNEFVKKLPKEIKAVVRDKVILLDGRKESLPLLEIDVGNIAGFPLKLTFYYSNAPEYVIKGEDKHTVYMVDNPVGMIRSLEGQLQFERTIEKSKQEIESAKKKLDTLKEELNKPFKYKDELINTAQRIEELEIELGMREGSGGLADEMVDAEEEDIGGITEGEEGTIEIVIKNGKRIKVPGEHVLPGLAVAENKDSDGNKLGWTVTHTPSGLSLGRTYKKKETALAAAKAVVGLTDDWTIVDAKELVKKLDLDKMRDILDRYQKKELDEIEAEEMADRTYDALLSRSEIGEYEAKSLRHDPAITSLKQVARGLKALVKLAERGVIDKPAFHFDVGGGAYDLGIEYLAEHGIECILWDPEARPPDYNTASLERLKQVGGADTASLNNVLNILPEKEDRLDAVRFMFHRLRQGGAGIITVYEGKGTGKMEKVTKGHRYNYQLNRKLEDYLPEVMEALPGNVAEIQKKYGAIIITKKKPLSMAELAEGLPGKPVQETLVPITQKMAAKEKPVKFRTKKPAYQEDMDDRLPEILESVDNGDPEKYKAATNSLKDDTGDKMMDRVVRKEKLVKMIDRIVPLYVGRVRGKRRVGFFKAKEELIRIKTEFFSDLDYLTHELGHFLDKELMLTRRKVMRMAMQKDLGNRAYDILTSELVDAPYVQEILLDLFPEADFKLQVHEGLADFIRAYIVEPTEAEKKFPNFFIYFERMLGLADGDITEKIGELRRAVALYINQPPEAMIASFVGSDEKERSSILSWYYKVVDEGGRIAYVVEQIIGDKRFWGKSPGGVDIISPNENPYLLYKVSRAFQSKAHLYVKHGQYTRDKNNKLKKEGPSLDEITRPVFELGKHENGVSHFDRWTYYMIAKRAIEIEDVKGLKSGMDKYQMQAARDFVDSIEGNKEKGIKRAEHADIYEEQFVKLVKFMHFNLRQLLDAGIIDGDTYDKIIKENEFYIPFYRVRSDRSAKKAEGQHLGNTPKGVYRYRGASLPIYNPWDSILRQVFIYTALADKNIAINALVDMAEKWEGTGQYFAKIPAPMQVTATTLGEVLAEIGIHISDEIALEKIGEAIAEEAGTNEIDMDAIIKIFRPSQFANVRENVIMVWKNGKPVFYEFRDKELLKAIMHLDTDAVTLLDKLARPFSQVLRVGATWNPRFIGFNPFRDNILSGIWGVAGYLPFVDLFRGVYHIAKKSDEYKDWLEAGGAMSTLNTWDRNYFKEYAGKYVEKKYYESVLRAINPIGWLGKASGVMEYATNIGQYVKAREKGAHPVAANFFGRDITVDHLRHGSQTHRIRAHIPFFNAWVQGTDKSWRAFKKNPTQFVFRALIMITLPTVALYLINRRNPYYQELPSWRRFLYWNIPVPIGGSIRTTKYFIMLPRPFIPGLVFGGMVEYLMNKIDKENRAAWDDLAKDIFNTVLPNYTPAWLGPPLELWANTKIYSGAPVVPASEERLWPSDQYGPYTSEMAKKLGKALNTSPRKIDALVYGYTAGLGRYAVRGIDEILYLVGAADKEMRPAGTIQDIPLLGDIIVASGSYGPANLTRFYNDLRKAEKIAAKELKALERGEVISLTQKEQLYRNHLSALRSINRDLATLNRYIDEIYRNETLSRKEKREMLDYLELAKINKVRVAYGLDPIPTN